MHPHHVFGALGDGGNFVHVQGRRVGRQNRTRFAQAIQIGKDLLFQVHVFEHGLNHHVRVGNIVEIRRPLDARQGAIHFGFGETATLLGAAIVLFDRVQTTFQVVGVQVDHRHVVATGGHRHGDAAAHCARAKNGDLFDVAWFGILGHARHFQRGAFGKEQMAHRLAFITFAQFVENLALLVHAIGKSHLHRRAHSFDAALGGDQFTGAGQQAGGFLIECGFVRTFHLVIIL